MNQNCASTLGRMDSNHNSETQILVSYHWTTSQMIYILYVVRRDIVEFP